MAWHMTGQMIEACSCKMLCPCYFGPEEPDQRWCSGVPPFDIQQGESDGVNLGGCKVVWLIGPILVLLVGCASIINGEIQTISFKSHPSNAKLIVYDLRKGVQIINDTTPYTAILKRGYGYFKKGMYKVVIEKEGYENQEILIEGSAGGWYLVGNLLIGGIIGWLIVDPATGAMWTL